MPIKKQCAVPKTDSQNPKTDKNFLLRSLQVAKDKLTSHKETPNDNGGGEDKQNKSHRKKLMKEKKTNNITIKSANK
ncbi:hypothetical protein BDV25DRAFT_144625 [Aspergillus avenaceus]|uniref:Uncharacterized protein n=1 Tax=Aspergillus avenaceus TaxID=36643 RepID=A0A5N6TGJ0_ASPAV|nr:hypothetical protein BDV25DRAFT_144625 [Aspergillus avenaceus]